MSTLSTLTTSIRILTAAAVAAVAFSASSGMPANASPTTPDDRPGWATIQGRTIDLASGWHSAQTCVVFTLTNTRCFLTHHEADTLLGYSRATDPLHQQAMRTSGGVSLAAVPACAYGWLCLYENENGGGRRLIFSEEYWMYLSTWGFDRQTSSWRNNQGLLDKAHLSMYNLSGVYNLSASTYVAKLGSYNDQAYAVWA